METRIFNSFSRKEKIYFQNINSEEAWNLEVNEQLVILKIFIDKMYLWKVFTFISHCTNEF